MYTTYASESEATPNFNTDVNIAFQTNRQTQTDRLSHTCMNITYCTSTFHYGSDLLKYLGVLQPNFSRKGTCAH